MVQTDDNGIARARIARPNHTEGDFNVRVNAQANGLQGTTEIHLHSILPTGPVEPPSTHAVRWAIIGSAVAGGLAVALLTRDRRPTTTISPGNSTVNPGP
jgi:hypothetical protein